MTLTERFGLDRDGLTLAGERVGRSRVGGPPTVVFLHAGVADRRSWDAVVDDLVTGGWTGPLVSYDRRAHGQTPPSPSEYTDLADLLAVLDVVSPGRPAFLVGSSMGGAIALEAVVTAPDRVAGLALIAPGVPGMPEYADNPPELDALVEAHREAYERHDLAEINRVEAHLWLDGPLAPEGRVGGAARELFLAMNAVALEAEGDDVGGDADVDVWAGLTAVTAPLTLVYGALDADVPREEPPGFVRRRPGTSWEIWPDRSHLPYLEDAAQTADLVRRAVGTAITG